MPGSYTALCLFCIFRHSGDTKWWWPEHQLTTVQKYFDHAARIGKELAQGVQFLLECAEQLETWRNANWTRCNRSVTGFLHTCLNIIATDLIFAVYTRTEDPTETINSLLFGMTSPGAPSLCQVSEDVSVSGQRGRQCSASWFTIFTM
jgi:hypothetical protein